MEFIHVSKEVREETLKKIEVIVGQNKQVIDNLIAFKNANKPDREFSQSEFIEHNKYKLNTDAMIANSRYGGLCQAFCGLIAIVGHDNKAIDEILRKNESANATKIINDIAMKGHALKLINIFERILIILFKMFPASPMKLSDQKQFLHNDSNGVKAVNQNILQKTFDNMKDNEYMQLSFVKVNKFGLLNLFKEGHATLIFKTNENGKTFYNFFDPNHGFFKSENVADIANNINNTVIKDFPDFTELGVIDLRKVLARSAVSRELMREHDKKHQQQNNHLDIDKVSTLQATSIDSASK